MYKLVITEISNPMRKSENNIPEIHSQQKIEDNKLTPEGKMFQLSYRLSIVETQNKKLHERLELLEKVCAHEFGMSDDESYDSDEVEIINPKPNNFKKFKK